MRDLELRVGDRVVAEGAGWRIAWSAEDGRVAYLTSPTGRRLIAVVEGAGSDWSVTIRGRRIGVTARTWRERVLAEAESAAASRHGPIEIVATLPGLVVAIEAEVGSRVESGDRLLTIEAMKMQNEVRAPRDATVLEVAVESGQTVATGSLLLRLG